MKSGDSTEPSGFAAGLFQLHPTLDALSTFIYVKDRDLRIVSANRAFCDALGVTREELLGSQTMRYLGASGSESERIDREVISSGVPRLGVVESYPAPDGLHWVVTDKAPIRGPDGTVVGLVGTSIDITAQKGSDERLRQSESQLRFLTEHMADILWTMDLQFHTTFVTPSITRVLGFTPEERRLQSLQEMVTLDSAGRILTELQRQLQFEVSDSAQRDRTLTIDVEYFRKDGSTVWMETLIQAVRDDTGTLVGMVGVSRDITERRKAEEAMRRSETHLRFLTDNTADVIWTMDLEFHTTYISPSVERVLGFTPDEWMRMPFDRMATPESVAREYAALQRELTAESSGAADPHRTLTIDVEMYHKGGSTVWMEIVIRAIRDDTGKLVGMVGVSRDITERRRGAEALRESEEKYRELFEQSIAPISLISPEGRVLEANPAWLKMFGYAIEDLQDLNVRVQYLDPDERTRFLKMIRDRGRIVDDETRLKRKDGTVLDVLRSVTVRRRPAGDIIGFQNVFRDVTAQKQAERALRDSEERYRALFEQSLVPMSLISPAGQVLEANPAWFGMFGLTPADLPSFHARDFYVDPDGRDRFLKAIATDGRIEDEVQFKRRDGAVFTCRRSVALLRAPDDSIIGFQNVFYDITAQKQVEYALRESEEKYRTLFEQSVDAINLVSLDGTIVGANQAWFTLFGYTPEDLERINVRDMYMQPDGRDRFLRMIAEQDRVEDEVQFKRKDGTAFDCHRSVTARHAPDGSRVGYQTVFHDITQRKRAEQALKESEEQYRALFELSKDAAYLVAPDGHFIEVNQAWIDLFGYSRDEASRMHVEAIYEDPVVRTETLLPRIAQEGEVVDWEVRFKKRDGTIMDCLCSVVARRDQSGATICLQGIVRDITERKRAQQALKESEEKYRTLFEQSVDAINLVGIDGRLIDANPAWFSLFGYTPDDVGSYNAADVYVEPEGRARFLQAISLKDAVEDETQFRRRDGTVFDCHRVVTVRRDSDGSVVGYQTVFHDVTETRKAERALRESEDRYRTLMTNLNDVVYELDADGRFTFVGPQTLEVTGYTPEDVIGRPFSDFVHPGDLPRITDHWRGVTSGEVDPVEFRMLKPGGEPYYVRISGRAIMRNGRFEGSTGIMTDINKEVEARNALHASEEKFRALFEQSIAPISLITPDGRLIEANDAWFRLLGYSREDIPSFNAAHLFPSPEMREEFVQRLLRCGSLTDDESRVKTRDGAFLDVVRSISVRYNPDGTVLGFQTVLRDVTAERAAARALRENEQKYRQLFDQSIAPISLLAPDGHLIDANDAWFQLFGYSREDAPSINAVNLYPTPELREESVRRLLNSGTLIDDEARVKTKDGTIIDVLRSMVVRHNPDGSVLGYQTVWRDVTELHRVQDELLASREQLRQLALRIQDAREDERTAIARELHDHFGQELTALRLDLESLTSGPPPAGDGGLVRIRGILQLVDRMSQEVRRVISEMRPGMLDDLGLCAALEWQAGQFSERTGIACNLILTADDTHLPPSVNTALFRTFQELLTNVARHAGANYVDVSLISDSDCVYLAVVDDGRGITDEELHDSTSLGILGIQERIRACGGNVTFQGEPGKGTTVTVTVPLQTCADDGWQTRLGLR